jgi:hypothetical protein
MNWRRQPTHTRGTDEPLLAYTRPHAARCGMHLVNTALGLQRRDASVQIRCRWLPAAQKPTTTRSAFRRIVSATVKRFLDYLGTGHRPPRIVTTIGIDASGQQNQQDTQCDAEYYTPKKSVLHCAISFT